MPQHGDCDSQKQRWYCSGYWMTADEWFAIHDYAPPSALLKSQQDKIRMYETATEEVEQEVEETEREP